jgi:DNA (cytosine-5)-methyltransferase 1
MTRPRLLDLFCGAGGCAMGYHRAGFDVVGVDIKPQKRYPFTMVVADALTPPFDLREFDAIHASPPCQQFSVAKRLNKKCNHADLLAPTRHLLESSGRLWVIENVPGAPLIAPALLCGLAFGLNVKRHRLFESNVMLFGTVCPKGHRGNWVTVYGGGAPAVPDNRRRANLVQRKEAMGIDWMGRDEMSLAIPPAYTEYIGNQLMRIIGG